MNVPPPTHYDVLGVEPDASADELRAAYKRAARRAHPDHGGSHAAMRAVNVAWEVLSDPDSRRRYDESLGDAPPPPGPDEPPPGPDEPSPGPSSGPRADGPTAEEEAAEDEDIANQVYREPALEFPASDSRVAATAQTFTWTFRGFFSVVADFIWPFWRVAALLVLFTSPLSLLSGLFGVGGLGHHFFWGAFAFAFLTLVPATIAGVAAGVIMGSSVGTAHLLSWLRREPKVDVEASPILVATQMVGGSPDYEWPEARFPG